MVSYSSCKQSLARTGRSVHQDTLGLGDTQRIKYLRVLDWKFDDFFDLSDLLFKPTNHVVGGVGHLFDLHETYKWVNHAWEHFVKRALTSGTQSDSCIRYQCINVNFAVNVDYNFSVSVLLNQALLL